MAGDPLKDATDASNINEIDEEEPPTPVVLDMNKIESQVQAGSALSAHGIDISLGRERERTMKEMELAFKR